MEQSFNHFDAQGNAIMVDVTGKDPTFRTAVAEGKIRVTRPILDAITGRTAAKGDVLGVARVAGIMAAKRTSELIPLCHPLLLSHLSVDFAILEEECAVQAMAAGIRVESDLRSEKMGYKIREAQLKKIPYMLVVGDKEMEDGTVAVRARKEEKGGTMTVDAFLAAIRAEIDSKER